MEEHDEDLNPHMPAEDVVQRFSQLSTEDAQLVDELHEHYALMRVRRVRTLARAWARIQQEQQVADIRVFQVERRDTSVPMRREIERKSHMDKRISGLQKPIWLGRTVNGLVAAVLLTMIIGSMVLVYSHLHAQTSTGSGNPGVQATATIPQQTTPNAAVTVTNGGKSLTWVIGQDTYWANQRYHQLTGFWVTWTGDSDQWVAGARAAGWMVSQKPHIPSIVVLMPGVQNAGNFGHVAIAEAINTNGSVHTSNMDWYWNGGGWNRVSFTNFAVGAGVYFIWHP